MNIFMIFHRYSMIFHKYSIETTNQFFNAEVFRKCRAVMFSLAFAIVFPAFVGVMSGSGPGLGFVIYFFAVSCESVVELRAIFSYRPHSPVVSWFITPFEYRCTMMYLPFSRANQIVLKCSPIPCIHLQGPEILMMFP